MEAQTLIFFGTQGSGKGTQIKLLKDFLVKEDPKRSVVHVEMGNELRRFMMAGENNYTRKLVENSMLRGEFQPIFLVTHLMGAVLIDSMTGNDHLITDGFPREEKQMPIFDSVIEFYKRERPTILNLAIHEEESVKRLLARGRSDDTEAGIRERLGWNRSRVQPMIEAYRCNPAYRVIDIDGVGEIGVIHQNILNALELI